MKQKVLEFLEPKDVYEQALKPTNKRSIRMRISDLFWKWFMQ